VGYHNPTPLTSNPKPLTCTVGSMPCSLLLSPCVGDGERVPDIWEEERIVAPGVRHATRGDGEGICTVDIRGLGYKTHGIKRKGITVML
jgi:hypothetical protein